MSVNVYTIGVLDEIIPGRITESVEVEAENVAEAFLAARTVGKLRTKTLTILSAWPKPVNVFTDTPAARWHRALWGYTPTEDEREYMATQEGRYLSEEDEILELPYDNADDNWGGW